MGVDASCASILPRTLRSGRLVSGVPRPGVIYGKGRPLAIGTTGKRPDLKRISGQEKLPVLALTDGTTVNREKAIVAWAAEHEASTR